MTFAPLTRLFGAGLPALLLGAAAAQAAAPVPDVNAPARLAWRQALVRAVLPADGCFKASYPTAAWTRTACVRAPLTQYRPRSGAGVGPASSSAGNTVGDGHDYAAASATPISASTGSFPKVTGVTSETGFLNRANTYSLQLNSEFFATTVCNGAAKPSACLGWQQFVYSTTSAAAYMQYWLINWGNKCPSGGWMAAGSDCYRNSKAVAVPKELATSLASLTITGTAAANGVDKMIMTTATSAYTTAGKDTVVQLAHGWTQSEYNVVGDGDGSAAKFNTGSAITVTIALTDGATVAPSCASDAGTTAETNNLSLGACAGTAGASPSITFVESN